MKKDLNALYALLISGIKDNVIDELKNNAGTVRVESNAFDDRTVRVHLENRTDSDLSLKSWRTQEGKWRIKPPRQINAFSTGTMETGSDDWTGGTTAFVKYKTAGDVILKFRWDNPYIGFNEYADHTTDQRYVLSRSGGGGNNAVVTWAISIKSSDAR